eukprot:6213937-Pleurochrysis_carterae.AAC.9
MADEGDYSATLLQPQLVSSAAKLLAQQWPTQSVETRAASLDSACRRAATALPCHLVLVQGKAPSFQRVVAHARVQQACENADGFSAAVTSVVVDPRYRRHGLGKRLLRFVEKYASELGYGYMYLWTHDRQDFYYACGYSECEKVTMLSPAMSKLGGEAVGRLEALFSRKVPCFHCLLFSTSGHHESSREFFSTGERIRLESRRLCRVHTTQMLACAYIPLDPAAMG